MSKPPTRLVEDPEALASLRANLQRVREADGGYDAARGLARLQSELNLLGTRGVEPQAPATEALRFAGLGSSKALWLALVGACVIAASSLVVIWPLRTRQDPPTRAQPVAAPPVITATTDAGTPDAGMPQLFDMQDVPRATLRREIEQLAEIRALLPRKPAAAYKLALRSAREFPHGALREEREALTALALSQLGDAEQARKLARAFVLRYPNSPLRAVVERLLEDRAP